MQVLAVSFSTSSGLSQSLLPKVYTVVFKGTHSFPREKPLLCDKKPQKSSLNYTRGSVELFGIAHQFL